MSDKLISGKRIEERSPIGSRNTPLQNPRGFSADIRREILGINPEDQRKVSIKPYSAQSPDRTLPRGFVQIGQQWEQEVMRLR